MRQALHEAEIALSEGEFPVGCVLVADREIVARGRRMNSQSEPLKELDHAEIVALRSLASSQKTYKAPLIAYATMEPCLMCFASLLLNGVSTVVYAFEDPMGGGTSINLQLLAPLYRQMRPTVIDSICRNESIALFQRFFRDPANSYWQDSFLASYTLNQNS